MAEAYIVPGFRHSGREQPYSSIRDRFKSRGIEAKVVGIKWEYGVMSDYVKQFLDKCEHNNSGLLGFSLGAMIAFISAPEVNPKKLFLCSLSPYFKEDLRYIPEIWRDHIGKRRYEDFKKISFNKIAKNISCPVYITLGSLEDGCIKVRANKSKKRIKNSTAVIIAGVDHDISNRIYLDTVGNLIEKNY